MAGSTSLSPLNIELTTNTEADSPLLTQKPNNDEFAHAQFIEHIYQFLTDIRWKSNCKKKTPKLITTMIDIINQSKNKTTSSTLIALEEILGPTIQQKSSNLCCFVFFRDENQNAVTKRFYYDLYNAVSSDSNATHESFIEKYSRMIPDYSGTGNAETSPLLQTRPRSKSE